MPPQAEREVIGWGSGGPMYVDTIDASHRKHTTVLLLEQVADALGDVDGYIAQTPTIAA